MQREKPSSYRYRTLSGDEAFVADHWEEAETLAESQDPNANYDFNDYALVRVGLEYFVTNASGCSCPSHEDVWMVEFRGDLPAVESYITATKGGEAWAEFQREVHKVWSNVPNPAPGPRFSW